LPFGGFAAEKEALVFSKERAARQTETFDVIPPPTRFAAASTRDATATARTRPILIFT
jgi:hypothetical protein